MNKPNLRDHSMKLPAASEALLTRLRAQARGTNS